MDAEELAFLAAIVARPDDDMLRLVYADWLEEHGHSDRGAFLRLQVQAASPSARRVITQAVLEENVRLRGAAPAAWAVAVAPRLAPYFGSHDRYKRGLLAEVRGEVARLLLDLPELFRLAPLRDVILLDYAEELAQLLQLGELSRLRRLVVQAPLDPADTERFLLALTQSRPVSGLEYAVSCSECLGPPRLLGRTTGVSCYRQMTGAAFGIGTRRRSPPQGQGSCRGASAANQPLQQTGPAQRLSEA